MKKIFSVNRTTNNVEIALFVARVGIAILMLTHGISKIPLLNETPIPFMNIMGLGAKLSLSLAIFAEVGCSILILIGLGTRLAVIPLMVTMLIAVLMVHSTDPFSKQELGLLYLLVYTVLLLMGSGKYSLDKLISAKR